MEGQANNTTRRHRATLIGLALVGLVLLASNDVGRSTTMRHFLNERYSADYVIGENALPRIGGKGIGTGGQRPADFSRQTLGAGEATVLSFKKAFCNAADGQSQYCHASMRGAAVARK